MSVPVTIEFTSPGLLPPVFVATSLSDPQWHPLEMKPTRAASGEFHFSKTFHAQEGEYQYKLRLGPGDWWVCDDSKPQVDDGVGNKNNLVTVKTAESQHDRADSVFEHGAPLMPHERHESPEQPSSFSPPLPNLAPVTPNMEHQVPFFKHESLALEASGEKAEENVAEAHSPLLRHESVAPNQEAVSPLFRHENSAIDDQKHEDRSTRSPLLRGRKHSGDSVPEEADPNEPGLEQFPTDHRGILESIARAKTSMAEDETSDFTPSPPPPPPQASARPSPSLPSLPEECEGVEVQDATKVSPANISEADERPAALITPPLTPTKETPIDPIAEVVQQKVQQIQGSTKNIADQAAQKACPASPAGMFSRSVFAVAVALTAVGLWYFAESGRSLGIKG